MKMKALWMVLLAIVLCAGVFAQGRKPLSDDPNTRSVQGVVTDAADHPVPGAVVQLKDMKTLQIRSFYTQQGGAFHFAGLSTNVDYQLKADHDGHTSGTHTLSVYDSRKMAVLNLKLK